MVVFFMVCFINKVNVSIEEIGFFEKIIFVLGLFVIGNSFDFDEVLEISVEKKGDFIVSLLMILRLVVVYLYCYLNWNVLFLFEDD